MDNKNIIIDNKFKGGPLTICFVTQFLKVVKLSKKCMSHFKPQEGFIMRTPRGREVTDDLSSSWKNQCKCARGFVLIEAISTPQLYLLSEQHNKGCRFYQAKKN
jgi:hypothetical protein